MRLLDVFIPTSHRDNADLRARARLAVAMVLLTCVACALFVAVNLREGNPSLTALFGFGTGAALLCLAAFRVFDSITVPMHGLAIIFSIVLVMTCVDYGKADVGTLTYFAVIPIALLFVGGTTSGVTWLVIGVLISGAVCFADAHHWLPPGRVRNNIVSDFANVVVVPILVFGFALLFHALKQDAIRAAEAASRAKGNFLATMTHELRTPLNGVIGMADILIDGSNADSDAARAQRDIARTIRRSGEALLEVIDDILNFEKIEAGALKVVADEMEPRALTAFVRDLLAVRAAEKDLFFETTVDDTVPTRVRADLGALRQVLLNLVGNALKFTSSGAVRVRVKAPSATLLRFEVEDTGIGIDPALRPRLFEPFTQGDSSTSRRYGGTGLGLSISRRLVTAMGGRIDFDSNPGGGALFWFEVPVEPVVVTAPPAARAPSEAASGRRALIVEDNPVNQRVTEHLLRARGLACAVAHDGDEALKRLAEARFDVVFMDVQLPGIDGLETTRRVRARENGGKRVPIVAMTAGAHPGDREACLQAGMDDYLSKPVTPEELDRVIARLGAGQILSP